MALGRAVLNRWCQQPVLFFFFFEFCTLADKTGPLLPSEKPERAANAREGVIEDGCEGR